MKWRKKTLLRIIRSSMRPFSGVLQMNQWESADAPAASTVYSSLSAKGTVKVSWLLLLLVLLVVQLAAHTFVQNPLRPAESAPVTHQSWPATVRRGNTLLLFVFKHTRKQLTSLYSINNIHLELWIHRVICSFIELQ